jgi:hypothetical protein
LFSSQNVIVSGLGWEILLLLVVVRKMRQRPLNAYFGLMGVCLYISSLRTSSSLRFVLLESFYLISHYFFSSLNLKLKPMAQDAIRMEMANSLATISSLHSKVQIGSALVIGGCGFLGHHVVKTLLAEPTCTSVAVMSRSPFQRRLPNVTYHVGDITKAEHVDNLIDQIKPNVIINTASPHAYIDHEHAYQYFTVK